MVDINKLLTLAKQYRTNPLDTTHEAKQLLAAIDADKKDGISKDEFSAFEAVGKDLTGDQKVLFDELTKIVNEKIKTAAPDSLKVKVSGKDFDLSTQELIQKPFRLKNDTEQSLWLNEIHKSANRGVTVSKSRAVSTVGNVIAGRNISEDAVMEDVVQKLWDNNDSIGGEKRKVFRMEEILGMQEAIKALPPDKQKAALELFGKKMGEYIHKNFGDDAQFTMDTFIALHQSTDWGKGGHTTELQNFYKSMLGEMCKNVPHLKEKIDKLADGEAVVLGNYDVDGGPFGSSAFYVKKEGANLSFDFIEHIKAPEGSKTIGVDPEVAQKELGEVVKSIKADTSLKPNAAQAKALTDLEKSIPSIPAILSGEPAALQLLFDQLIEVLGIAGLKDGVKDQLKSLIEQVGKLLGKSAEEIKKAQGPSAIPASTGPGGAGAGTGPTGGPTGTPPASGTPAKVDPKELKDRLNKIPEDLKGLENPNVLEPLKEESIKKIIEELSDKTSIEDIKKLQAVLENLKPQIKEDAAVKANTAEVAKLTKILTDLSADLEKLKTSSAPTPVSPPSPTPVTATVKLKVSATIFIERAKEGTPGPEFVKLLDALTPLFTNLKEDSDKTTIEALKTKLEVVKNILATSADTQAHTLAEVLLKDLEALLLEKK
jgi:hypothetical protein